MYIYINLIEFIQIRLDKWPLRLQLILTRFLMGNACDHQRKRNWINITKFPIPFHAQEKLLVLIIVVEMTSNFRQEIRYSYYRNDPVKYDLNVFFVFYISHSFQIFSSPLQITLSFKYHLIFSHSEKMHRAQDERQMYIEINVFQK